MTTAEAHQSRLLARADRSADAAERAVREIWRRLLAAIQSGGSYPVVFQAARAALRGLPSVAGAVLDDLGQVYRDAAAWSAKSVIRRMTRAQAENALRRRGLIEHRYVHDIQKLILPPLPLEQIHAVVYQAGWVGRVQSLTGLANPDALAARLAFGVQAGESVAKLAAEIRPLVQGVQTAARRVARTAGLWIAHEAELATYEQLGDMIEGYEIHAVLDHATRPEHRKRDGWKFYREPKGGQRGFDQMPRPPREADGSFAWNCRCWLEPILHAD